MDESPVAPVPASPGSAVIGIGVDIIEIERVRLALERGGERFLTRVFSPTEAAYCRRKRYPERHLAARFAAKESVIKALRVPPGLGWLWREIEVSSRGGPPTLVMTGRALERAKHLGVTFHHLTMSHSNTHAVAMVVLT